MIPGIRPLQVIVLAILLMSSPLHAQQTIEYSEKAEALFKNGVSLYASGMYREAGTVFDRVLREYPRNQRITAALVMKGKALFQLKENLETAKILKSFLSAYPMSSYVPDAEFTLGLVYQRIGRFEEAMQQFVTAWRAMTIRSPEKLLREIRAAMDTTINAHIPITSVLRLLDESTVSAQRAFFWLKVAEMELARENTTGAAIALDTLAIRYPESDYRERISRWRSVVSERSTVKLGVLLPLMRNSEPSAIKDIGNEVFDGVLLAVEQYQRDPSVRVKVTLETKDTERDAKVATRVAQDIVDEKEVVGIIGPVFSASTSAAASIANTSGVPLVSPTANANGIAGIGKYVFQANPDYDTRGRAMARYAILKRGYKTLAVLAPMDTYGRFMAEGFISEARKLGAKILATEWYQRGTSDFKQQLSIIRRAGMLEGAEPQIAFGGHFKQSDFIKLVDLGVPVKRLDSLMNKGSIMSATALLGPRGKGLLDSLGITVTYDETRVDSLEYPVVAVEGFYVPISSPEEIGVISSQLVYFNFQTQMLGSGEWNDFNELNANRQYSKGVLFESDAFIDTSSASYSEFSNNFIARFKKRPTKNSLYGYDTAQLMLSLIRNGATSREALTRALESVRDYRGLHSMMSLSRGRVNSWLPILQYDADAIHRVDEINVDQPLGEQGHGEPSKK